MAKWNGVVALLSLPLVSGCSQIQEDTGQTDLGQTDLASELGQQTQQRDQI